MGKGGIVLIKAVESIDGTVVDWTDGVPVSLVPAKLAWFHQVQQGMPCERLAQRLSPAVRNLASSMEAGI